MGPRLNVAAALKSRQISCRCTLGADWTAIWQKVLSQAKKSPLGRRAGDLLSNGWLHPTTVDVKSL